MIPRASANIMHYLLLKKERKNPEDNAPMAAPAGKAAFMRPLYKSASSLLLTKAASIYFSAKLIEPRAQPHTKHPVAPFNIMRRTLKVDLCLNSSLMIDIIFCWRFFFFFWIFAKLIYLKL